MRIRRPHENRRAAFSDFSTLRPVFKKVRFQDQNDAIHVRFCNRAFSCGWPLILLLHQHQRVYTGFLNVGAPINKDVHWPYSHFLLVKAARPCLQHECTGNSCNRPTIWAIWSNNNWKAARLNSFIPGQVSRVLNVKLAGSVGDPGTFIARRSNFFCFRTPSSVQRNERRSTSNTASKYFTYLRAATRCW